MRALPRQGRRTAGSSVEPVLLPRPVLMAVASVDIDHLMLVDGDEQVPFRGHLRDTSATVIPCSARMTPPWAAQGVGTWMAVRPIGPLAPRPP